MYIKNRNISFAYKVIAVLFCIAGQILAAGILDGQLKANQLLYYTNQSNILCLIYFACAAVFVFKKIKGDGTQGAATFAPRFKGAVVMAITVTFLIYWLLLNNSGFSMAPDASEGAAAVKKIDIGFISNHIVHTIVPLLTIFDWVLFDPKGSFKKIDPVIWVVIPLVYYGFALIVAQTGYTYWNGTSRYPYFFIDSDLIGWGAVCMYVVGLVVGFILLGYLMFGLDRVLARRAHGR